MQWNVAEGYDLPYQEPGPATVAIAETMNKVSLLNVISAHTAVVNVLQTE